MHLLYYVFLISQYFKFDVFLVFIEHTNTLYLKVLPQLVGAVPRLLTHPYLWAVYWNNIFLIYYFKLQI